LIKQRQQLPALAANAARQILATDCAQVLSFVRGDVLSDAHLIYLSNFSELPQSLLSAEVFEQIPFATSNDVQYVDVLSGEVMRSHISLAAYSQRWLRVIGG
jgi:glutaredoxin-related protein